MIATEATGKHQLPEPRRAKSLSRDDDRNESVVLDELRGNSPTVVSFSTKMVATFRKAGGEWIFEIRDLGVRTSARNLEEARHKAADALAAEVKRLARAFPDELTRAERERRGKLLKSVDLLGGEIGLDFPETRWLLGHVKDAIFTPIQKEHGAIGVPSVLLAKPQTDQLWFARVATFRDGRIKGEVLELKSARGEEPAAGAR